MGCRAVSLKGYAENCRFGIQTGQQAICVNATQFPTVQYLGVVAEPWREAWRRDRL